MHTQRIPPNMLTLSRMVDECKPRVRLRCPRNLVSNMKGPHTLFWMTPHTPCPIPDP